MNRTRIARHVVVFGIAALVLVIGPIGLARMIWRGRR
jgi:hypothetical protein